MQGGCARANHQASVIWDNFQKFSYHILVRSKTFSPLPLLESFVCDCCGSFGGGPRLKTGSYPDKISSPAELRIPVVQSLLHNRTLGRAGAWFLLEQWKSCSISGPINLSAVSAIYRRYNFSSKEGLLPWAIARRCTAPTCYRFGIIERIHWRYFQVTNSASCADAFQFYSETV